MNSLRPRHAAAIVLLALVVLAPIAGIWQKNRVESTYHRISDLKDRIARLEDANARAEIEIRRLSTLERIEPLAQARVGLTVSEPGAKVYLPIPPPAPSPPSDAQRGVDLVVATLKSGVDWALPGNTARAGN
jgi:hypothetical protein